MDLKRIWKNYNLGIVLAGLFLASWLLQGLAGWQEYKADQEAHAEAATVFGSSGYAWAFLEATLENWQSEFLQLLTFVVLTTYLIYRGSNESRDGQDEMKAAIDRIEQRLERLGDARAARAG